MKKFMIEKREALGLTRHEMAKKCDCSEALLAMLEESSRDITHPNIASRIAKEYGLSLQEYNRLVHPSRRADKLPEPVKRETNQYFYVAWRDGMKKGSAI